MFFKEKKKNFYWTIQDSNIKKKQKKITGSIIDVTTRSTTLYWKFNKHINVLYYYWLLNINKKKKNKYKKIKSKKKTHTISLD